MAVAHRVRRRGWMSAANKTAQTPEVRRPVVRHLAVRARTAGSLAEAKAYVFVVEGTLVDTVLPSVNCWVQTLAEFGFTFRTADVHRFHGMDAEEMLDRLLPDGAARETKELILAKYRSRYVADILPTLRAMPGVRELIGELVGRGAKVALVSATGGEAMAHYRALLNVDDLVQAVVSGDDVARGMPHPELLAAAMDRLGIRQPADALLIGSSPYDAEAAHLARVRAVGLLSGLFARADLVNAGCQAVVLDPKALQLALAAPDVAA
ncbi:MAG: HAD family hydrolase [Rhodoplanes sp.]|uniref:HAD family hydrolase n=1 Tax=Rhodoplanes sp. TaxID=1968906 RepID=UPI001795BC0F|nr:HAD family hydrolase [Rhodoplanes sp.]NVO14449.1 HAD family hydrolase [Rhodoplanes sp.]